MRPDALLALVPVAAFAATAPAAPAADPVAAHGEYDALPAPTALSVEVNPYAANRPRRYQVNSVLAFPDGTIPWGAVTRLQVKDGRTIVNQMSTTMDRLGHADFKLRLAKGLNPRRIRVQVFFEGNYTLAPFTSEKVRLR